MSDEFLSLEPPKSTGREHYHLEWLQQQLSAFGDIESGVVQASLCELTARSIHQAIKRFLPPIDHLIVCGGGAHNAHLMQLLRDKHLPIKVSSSNELGLHPDWVEAVAFAWMAKQTLEGKTSNLPEVTGAKEAVILGAIYPA